MVRLADIGEKAFLSGLLPQLVVDPAFVNGFGHDASVIDVGLDQNLAVKIDRAPFPVAIRHGLGTYNTWGRLAVVANVSDLLAVGALPRAMMLSMVLPRDFSAEDAQAIVEGCAEACKHHGIAFVGGDTKEGASAQVVGAAWGTVKKQRHLGRKRAAVGDALFVAGSLGGFAAALTLIRKQQGHEAWTERCAQVLTMPTARIKEGDLLRRHDAICAACDLSDGLTEAVDIFCGDNLGITLDEQQLPLHELVAEAATTSGAAGWRFAFAAGDWAIAFVVNKSAVKRFRIAIGSDMDVQQLGWFDASGSKQIRDLSGVLHQIPQVINEQFKSRIEDEGRYLDLLLGKPVA
jgi:thiamine-monophosphate kinase